MSRLAAHLAGDCSGWVGSCAYCADEQEQISLDVEALAESARLDPYECDCGAE